MRKGGRVKKGGEREGGGRREERREGGREGWRRVKVGLRELEGRKLGQGRRE